MARHPSRVYSSWVNGNEQFYFEAAPEALNNLIEMFGRMEIPDHEIRVTTGTGEAKSFDGHAIRYNVMLHVITGIVRAHTEAELRKGNLSELPLLPRLTIYCGDASMLHKLHWPTNASIESSVAGFHPPTFGLVVERILNFDPREKTAYLDLDTGRHVDPGDQFPQLGADATPAEVDLKVSLYESDTRARVGMNLALLQVGADDWNVPPDELRKVMEHTSPQKQVRLAANDEAQFYYFKTREGTTGVLQLQPVLDSHGLVRIRYKLVPPERPELR
jgi:hypothetical protein